MDRIDLIKKIDNALDGLSQGTYSGKRIIEYWGIPGIGKTHLLSHISEIAEARGLRPHLIFFPSEPVSLGQARNQLQGVISRIIDLETGHFKSEQKFVLLIDNAPNEWQQEDLVWLIEKLIPLAQTQGECRLIVFLTGTSRVISSPPNRFLRELPREHANRLRELKKLTEGYGLPSFDVKGTYSQLDNLSYKTFSSHIQRITYGLPLGNVLLAEKLRELDIANEAEFRAGEPELVKHLEKQIRAQKLNHIPEDLYKQIRDVSVCRYFDIDIFSAIYEGEGFDSVKSENLLQTMCVQSGVVRYVKGVNNYEVDPTLRNLLIRHWIVTNRDEFYDQCERALRVYEIRLDEKADIEKAELDALLRGELALMARLYKRYDSPDCVIQTILADRLARHLKEIYIGPESLDTVKLLAKSLEDDEELFCYKDELSRIVSEFVERHTKTFLQIEFENSKSIDGHWQVLGTDKGAVSERMGLDPTHSAWILNQMETDKPDLAHIGNLIRGQLTPRKIAKVLEDTRHPLELNVSGSLIPYELMRFEDESVLCLTRPVGRTLSEAKTTRKPIERSSRESMQLTKALLVSGGQKGADQGDTLQDEIDRIATILNSHNVIVDLLHAVDSHTFIRSVGLEEYQLIHIAGHVYDDLDEQEKSVIRGVLFSDKRVVQMKQIEPHLRKQRPLVFLNVSRTLQYKDGFSSGSTTPYQPELLDLLDVKYDQEELKTLCFSLWHLGVDFDNLRGEGKRAKARELITYLERQDKLDALLGELEKRADLRETIKQLRYKIEQWVISKGRDMLRVGGTCDLAIDIFRSGARHCLANLWSVTDESAGEFAVRFYTHLMSGDWVGEAVRQSRVELQRRDSAGSDWASYLLYGDPTLTLPPPVVFSDF